MKPLLGIAVAVMVFAAVRAMLWPGSMTLRVALEVSYRIVTVTAAIQMLRYRRLCRDFGLWLVSACLLLLHLDWAPLTGHWPSLGKPDDGPALWTRHDLHGVR